ncbi:ankyrin repeat domain-containing protein [Singulisphaera sp. GP187]|uniref:ankyrin repeat domain-containing protein n=1 Tax=Singulisphaera sp. GP187 TaxID=1882752 RepID=UPI0009FA85A9
MPGLFLSHGADVEASTIIDDNMTALMVAAKCGNLAAVRILLEHGADGFRREGVWNENAAGYARLKKHFEVVVEFIEHNRTAPH